VCWCLGAVHATWPTQVVVHVTATRLSIVTHHARVMKCDIEASICRTTRCSHSQFLESVPSEAVEVAYGAAVWDAL
jgi:hypothetical protein